MTAKDDHQVRYAIWFGFWFLLLGFIVYMFQVWLDKEQNPNSNPSSFDRGQVKEVILQRNRFGHYVTSGFLNGTPVQFMLDTGATDIVVPDHLAKEIGLQRGPEIEVHTANGRARAYLSRAKSVRIGNIELHSLDVDINPNEDGDEILLGMEFLKHIEFTQRGDQLILRDYR